MARQRLEEPIKPTSKIIIKYMIDNDLIKGKSIEELCYVINKVKDRLDEKYEITKKRYIRAQYSRKYYANNKHKGAQKKYYEKNKKKCIALVRVNDQKYRDILADYYVKDIIVDSYIANGLATNKKEARAMITQEEIEFKRASIQTKRLIKQKEKENKNGKEN